MNKLSEHEFIYLGKSMPIEFSEICKNPDFKDDILSRKNNPFRFFLRLNDVLKSKNMPTINEYVKTADYPKYIKDLFNMQEGEFKVKHPIEYDNFFKNLSENEQEKAFQSADFGARSIFKFEQDVIASEVFEDIIASKSFGALKPNPESSRSNKDKSSTKCDFIYETPESYKEHIKVPVELKVKWSTSTTIYFRGSAKTIVEDKGIVLTIYIKENKYSLVDMSDPNIELKKCFYQNKESDKVIISQDDIKDFKFWEESDMRNLMNEIYKLYKKRQ